MDHLGITLDIQVVWDDLEKAYIKKHSIINHDRGQKIWEEFKTFVAITMLLLYLVYFTT